MVFAGACSAPPLTVQVQQQPHEHECACGGGSEWSKNIRSALVASCSRCVTYHISPCMWYCTPISGCVSLIQLHLKSGGIPVFGSDVLVQSPRSREKTPYGAALSITQAEVCERCVLATHV